MENDIGGYMINFMDDYGFAIADDSLLTYHFSQWLQHPQEMNKSNNQPTTWKVKLLQTQHSFTLKHHL